VTDRSQHGAVGASEGPEPVGDQVGMCAVRVWRYGDGIVIRLQMRSDVESPGTEQVLLTSSPSDATAAVRDFIEEFLPGEPPTAVTAR
jgi:hypothetical protein